MEINNALTNFIWLQKEQGILFSCTYVYDKCSYFDIKLFEK